MPGVVWKAILSERKFQQLINKIDLEADFVHVVDKPTPESAILDMFLIRPRNIPFYCDVIPGISDHSVVILRLSFILTREKWRMGVLDPSTIRNNVINCSEMLEGFPS